MKQNYTTHDLSELATVLEKYRDAKISESHWDEVSKTMQTKLKQYEKEESALIPTFKDLNTPFTI